MNPKVTTWRFRAVDGVNVIDLDTLDGPRPRVIGKRWDDTTDAYVTDDANGTVVVVGRSVSIPRGHYNDALRRGELLPGDAETAAAFGLPAPVSAAKPKPAPVPALAKES